MLKKKEWSRKYYQKNKIRIREVQNKWRSTPKGREIWKECHLRYQSSPKGIYTVLRKNNPKGKIKITRKEFIAWYKNQEKRCYYCEIPQDILISIPLFNRTKKRLEIERKNNNLSYQMDNLILSCPRCNSIKSDILFSREMKEIGEKYLKPKWEKYVQKK